MSEVHLIVGLGNPGAKYENTRHNVGFRAIDTLARAYGLSLTKQEHKAFVASGTVAGKRVILAKPQTYMNLSGDSVVPLLRFYKIDPAQLIVVCDDLDIPLGTLRVRPSGTSGGQRGVQHIIERLGTNNFARVRIGISRPPGRMDPADWVLTPFKGDDDILASEVIDRAVKAVEVWLTEGVEAAMNRCNGSGEKPKKQPTPDPESSN